VGKKSLGEGHEADSGEKAQGYRGKKSKDTGNEHNSL
jgi:hypothetical protein